MVVLVRWMFYLCVNDVYAIKAVGKDVCRFVGIFGSDDSKCFMIGH